MTGGWLALFPCWDLLLNYAPSHAHVIRTRYLLVLTLCNSTPSFFNAYPVSRR